MIRRGVLSYLLLAALSPALAADGGPALEFDDGGRLVLHSLPPVLDDETVSPHLTRGLTTTFFFRVEPVGGRVRRPEATPGVTIEIRYELWDEVFHVATGTADGRVESRTLDSFGELESWWRGLRVVVAGGEPASRTYDPPRPREARVELDVVPFSQAEQRDTQRWFSESLEDASQSGAEDVAESAARAPDTLERTFHLLMATSIQRRALASYRWTVPIVQGTS